MHHYQKDTIIFTLPRSLTLSTRTSSLPSKFGERQWSKHGLHKGWIGLILCMLWEEASGEEGKWNGYLGGKIARHSHILLVLRFGLIRLAARELSDSYVLGCRGLTRATGNHNIW